MKPYWISFAASLAVYLLAMPLRGNYVNIFGLGGFPQSMLVGYMLYFAATLWLLHKFDGRAKKAGIFLSILTGCIILELPIRIITFQETLISLPDTLFKALSIVLAYATYCIKNRWARIAVSVSGLVLCVWMSLDGYYRYSAYLYDCSRTSARHSVSVTDDAGR